jgi:hypothetical protein
MATVNLNVTRPLTFDDYQPFPVTFDQNNLHRVFTPPPPLYSGFMARMVSLLLINFSMISKGSLAFTPNDIPGFYWIAVGFQDWENFRRTGVCTAPGSEDGSLQSCRGSFWFGNLHIYPAYALQMALYI